MAALLSQRVFVYPSALTSRWIYSRPLGAQDPGMPASTRQQAEEEERAATAVALEEAQGHGFDLRGGIDNDGERDFEKFSGGGK